MKKEVIAILFLIFGVVFSTSTFADEVGCCTNSGAGLLACSIDRLALRDMECCPKPESGFPGYYKSSQNPDGPTDSTACATNFFFSNKACTTVDACALGCCCTALGGSITPEAQCKGTGQTFNKGQTDCVQVCEIPQCNDGIDNDNNGCADDKDTACTDPSVKSESGGTCLTQGFGCNNANYVPKLSNLEITPAKGQRKFLLKWQDECSETAVSYDILRCKDSGCTNFALIGVTNINSFEDASGDLLFDTTYTYQIKARYNLQAATPTITKAANLGNLECLEQFSSNNFCIHEPYYNKYKNYLTSNFPNDFKNFADGVKSKFANNLNRAFSCDAANKLFKKLECSSTQVCVINGDTPSCLSKSDCKPASTNTFGLFYTLESCESNKYCFYDRSHSTIDSCFSCNPSMACYDYKTEESCARDNCQVGNCKWKALANQIGIGVCTSTIDYNCNWCSSKGTKTLENLRAFNEVFDLCTQDKSNALSEGSFKCYFSKGSSKNCNDVVCTDYESSQCGIVTHNEFNKIANTITNECGLNVCRAFNNKCSKDADGDSKADCTSAACENDYFAPNTTLLPIFKKGISDSVVIQIYDRTSINTSAILRTSQDYATYFCIEPCGQQGHPYNTFTTSRMVIISNLNAFDSNNGNKILTFSDGINIMRYYSQDPAKNIGDVKNIAIEVHSNTAGPKVFAVNVTDGSKVLDKIYTSNQQPTIEVQFFEPAIVTFARLVSKKTGQTAVSFPPSTQLNNNVIFVVPNTLTNGEYTFELNAKNKDNILMDPQLSQIVVIDNNKPNIVIEPVDKSVVNKSLVSIKITSDKEVNIGSVKLNSEEIKDKFTTSNNKLFTSTINMTDGNKKLEIEATDFAKNSVKTIVEFVVDANPIAINLANPRFGVSPSSIFDLVVETDNDALCRFSLDDVLEFDFMDQFAITGGTEHKTPSFNKIASGDTKTHKLNVRCSDKNRGVSLKSFDLSVDTTQPTLKSFFAFPNPVIEKPSTTTLTIEADEPVVCKFSNISREFDAMDGKFEGFDDNAFRLINKQAITLESEGSYLYFVACKNKAELKSKTSEIPFKVDLSVPLAIKSHTPDFFNSTNSVLAVETNKKSQCKFSETDSTAQNGEVFGAPGYSHTRQLILSQGKHTFFVVCKDQYLQKFSDVESISLTVDTTKPLMLYVNDTSTFEKFPEKTCLTDRLRVKWLGQDEESGIKEYVYSLIKKADNKPILSFIRSFVSGEWVWAENLNLEDNTEYFFRFRAKNLVNLEGESKDSDGITVDTSACLQQAKCGDGIISQPGEECDGNKFGVIDKCTQYTNFIGGNLKCSNCKLDTSECIQAPTCNNGQIDPGETCDGNTFGKIKTCSDYSPSLVGGTLKCNSKCELDTSACTEAPKCGNGKIDLGETCDGSHLGPLTNKCVDYNPSTFSGGTLNCNNNCKLDTTKCEGVQGTCGDNIVNIGETCDGNTFGKIKTCSDYSPSLVGGTLKCNSKCELDTSACTEAPKCGNNFIDKNESCDRANLGLPSNKCIDYSSSFNSGDLKCTNNCQLYTSDCTKASTCGNGKLDTGELCDSTNFGSIKDLSCDIYSNDFINGTLVCKSCRISTDNCIGGSTSIITCKDRGNCKLDEQCSDNIDCESRFCSNGKCTAATCSDLIKNQAESDLDCGGPCNKCLNDKACNANNDCQSNFCSFGFCKGQEICYDGKMSPAESDVDCGGPCPTKCPENRNCNANEDCEEGLQCTSSLCQRCADNDKNCNGIPDDDEGGFKDSDNDGLPDDWEIQNGLNPNDSNDAGIDSDNDGLTNLEEFDVQKIYGKSTNPNLADTDEDKFNDKEEVDKKTSPVDSEDFPKSNLAKIIMFALGFIVLLSGFGYLAYRVVQKRKEEKFETPKPREVVRTSMPQPKQAPPRQREEEIRLREALKRKEEIKGKEREKLFEAFGREGKEKSEEAKMAKPEPKEVAEPTKKKKLPAKTKKTPQKKPKEDVFIKLKEIAKEAKKRKAKRKNATK